MSPYPRRSHFPTLFSLERHKEPISILSVHICLLISFHKVQSMSKRKLYFLYVESCVPSRHARVYTVYTTHTASATYTRALRRCI